MRRFVILVFALLAAYGSADRIIFAPNALKVLNHQVRLEYLWEPSRPANSQGYLAVGLTREIEAEFLVDSLEGQSRLGTFNASYQYLVPIVDAAPGLAFGIQDAMDRTEAGRMYYLALTQRFGLEGRYNSMLPLELSVAFGFGRRSGVAIGVMLPFTSQFRILAEHDLTGVNAGFEFQPVPNAAIRTIFRQGQTQIGFRYTYRF